MNSTELRAAPGKRRGFGRSTTLARRLLSHSVTDSSLALLDQLLVSGTRMLTTVLLGRMAGGGELASYALGFTIVLLGIGAQDSLVSMPYMVYGTREDKRAEYYAGSTAIHGLALAISLMALLGVVAWTGLAGTGGFSAVIATLALALPLMLAREFARRLALSHLQMLPLLALDFAASVVQIGLLVWLALYSGLTAATAHAAAGLACGVVTLTWWLLARGQFRVDLRGVQADLRRGWLLGRWMLVGQCTSVVHAFGILWLLAAVLGPRETGIYAACNSVVLLSNPFILGIGNILGPKASWAFSKEGAGGLLRVVRWGTLLLGGVTSIFWLVVAIAGGWIVTLLFGSEFAGNGPVITIIALGLLASSLGMAADHGLRTLERTGVNLVVGLIGMLVTLVGALAFSVGGGLQGAAWGFVAGHVTTTVLRWAAFSAVVWQLRLENVHHLARE